MEEVSCPAADEQTQAMMDRLFPVKEKPKDKRVQRIVAPCGNETWKQCSAGCTKDIWEPDEIPSGICPHCGALLTGNTIEAHPYIEEGYLPQWSHYPVADRNLQQGPGDSGTWRGLCESGRDPLPFEKTAFFNQGSFPAGEPDLPADNGRTKKPGAGRASKFGRLDHKSDYNVE